MKFEQIVSFCRKMFFCQLNEPSSGRSFEVVNAPRKGLGAGVFVILQPKLIIVSVLFSSVFFGGLNATAQEQVSTVKRVQRYTKQELDILFLQGLSILPEHRIPLEYRREAAEQPKLKCPTFLILEIKQNLNSFSPEQQSALKKILARPQLPLSFIDSTGRFKVHYAINGNDSVSIVDDDNNGIPDYVEKVATAFQRSYEIEVSNLGYREAPDDLGIAGIEYDVYIQALSPGLYGFTSADSDIAKTPQENYIVMDNDFNNGHATMGIDGARVTAAHEYFHAIQFGYRSPFVNSGEVFYYELCSVWMEDVVYDDINDYFQYLSGYFERGNISFNETHNFNLGEAVWNHFLEKKFGERTLLRRTWEIMESTLPVMEAIDRSLQEKGSSFVDEFAELAVWNYFTGDRADSIQFYEEGVAYPSVRIAGDFQLDLEESVSDSNRSLTFRHYRFTMLNSGGLAISGNVDNPERWKFAAIIIQPGNAVDFHIFDISKGRTLGFIPRSSEIVVVPINIQILDGSDISLLRQSFSKFDFKIQTVPVDPSQEQGITGIYPNPFLLKQHGQMHFEFTPVNSEEFMVQIFTADGRVIRTVDRIDGSGVLTSLSFNWDGRDDKGDIVASGIYIFQLKQDGFHQFRKFAVIHE